MRVLHVITGLELGGAETMLCRLLRAQAGRVEAMVASLAARGPLAAEAEAAGARVESLGLAASRPDPRLFLRLTRLIRGFAPDVVQTWMYHADLIGGLAAKAARRGQPLAWGVRLSELDPAYLRPATRLVVRACAALSGRLPDAIVANAEASRASHAAIGYDAAKFVVIPNGFDLDLLRPDPAAREAVRRELGVGADAPLIGAVGRFDPQKDYPTFIAAAARVAARLPEARFLACGRGVDEANGALVALRGAAGLDGRLLLLGPRRDAPRVMAALDALALTSIGEGFPNVLGEAMATGVPCVSTDVGDARLLIGETGALAPPRDAEAVAAGLLRLLALPAEERARLSAAARRRIAESYGIEAAARRFEALWAKLAA